MILVKLYAGAGVIGYGIGKTFCRSIWDWLNFLQEYMGLVKLSARAEGLVAGLVKLSA